MNLSVKELENIVRDIQCCGNCAHMEAVPEVFLETEKFCFLVGEWLGDKK